MKVARNVTVDAVVLEDVADPVAGPGEVVCRVLACGVCGSDVSPSWVAKKVPAVLGHEVVGEVVAVGAGADGAPPVGTRVVIHHHAPCGACDRCRAGHDTLCDRFRTTRLDPGGFAEHVRVERDLVGELLPLDGLDVEAATFVEPLACVLRAFRRLPFAREPSIDRAGTGSIDESTLLVVGAGTSGLLAVLAARARGQRVLVREPRAERLALARQLGAEPHDGEERCAQVLVATGAQAAVDAGVAFCAVGATLLLYATPSARMDLDGPAVYLHDVTVTTSYSAGPQDMRDAFALLRSGAVDPRPLVTHRLPLDQTAEALRLQRTGEAVKALVLP